MEPLVCGGLTVGGSSTRTCLARSRSTRMYSRSDKKAQLVSDGPEVPDPVRAIDASHSYAPGTEAEVRRWTTRMSLLGAPDVGLSSLETSRRSRMSRRDNFWRCVILDCGASRHLHTSLTVRTVQFLISSCSIPHNLCWTRPIEQDSNLPAHTRAYPRDPATFPLRHHNPTIRDNEFNGQVGHPRPYCRPSLV
jgi:hypothetical protein